MAQKPEYERMYVAAIIFAVIILLVNLYYYCHPLLSAVSLTAEPLDYLMSGLRRGGAFSSPLKTKSVAMLILMLCSVIRSGKGRRVDGGLLVGVGVVSLFLYVRWFISSGRSPGAPAWCGPSR